MKMRLLVTILVLGLLGGCHTGRHHLEDGAIDRVLSAKSGDRFYFDLPKDAGSEWDFTVDDEDVEVTIERDDEGVSSVMIRVHRGFDGPSTIYFTNARNKFSVCLYQRTGDAAFWR